MSALPLRDQIIAYLEKLSDEQASKVLNFIQTIEEAEIEPDYDEEDPAIGFFSGPPDLAERSEEILQREYGIIKPQDAKDE